MLLQSGGKIQFACRRFLIIIYGIYMGIFISVSKTVECVLISLVYAAAFSLASLRPMGILQSAGYSGKKLFGWLKKPNNMQFTRMVLLTMLCVLSSAVVGLCFAFAGGWAAVISLVPSALFFGVYIAVDFKTPLRVPLNFTPRIKRLIAVHFTVSAICLYIFVTLLNFADAAWGNKIFCLVRYAPLGLAPLLIIPVLALSGLIARIYEVPHNRGFVKKAKAKLAASGVKTVAITGSYGKTTVKNILYTMLSRKYATIATPRSHNTPLGIALTVNNSDLQGCEYFIAEMGARHVGDIEKLCDVCPPYYSVITGVCPQHILTFGNFRNVVKAKGEILAATREEAVIADNCYELFGAYPVKKRRAAQVSEVCASPDGVKFNLTVGGETYAVQTCLLGAHSAENIAVAASAAYLCGMTPSEIAEAVPHIRPVEHRLQLIKSGGINIIDDGYNGNIRGARAAVETLKTFGGKRVCVTPGLVELGVLEKEENYALGGCLAGLDYVILVGDVLVLPIKQGFLKAGGLQENICVVKDMQAAKSKLGEVLSEGDAVLFLNDLPDIY